MRCTCTGRSCDGYDRKIILQTRKAPHKPLPRRRNLLPIALESEPYLSDLPIPMLFQDEEEARYFRFFYHETADALAGGFDSPLWKRIVLQACRDEPCILHCTVAIAALDKACRDRGSKSLSKASEAHHRYALSQYSKALKGIREVISVGEDSLRTTLIAALLIFCFENFHGDVRLALTNVQSAQELIHSWLESQGGSQTPRGLLPAPYVIEDQLVHTYAKLDVHLLSWIDSPRPTRPLHDKVPDVQAIPTDFRSLVESKSYFDCIATRIFHYLSTVTESKSDAAQSLQTPPYEEDAASPEKLTAVEEELLRWVSAFEPVLKYSSSPEGEEHFVGATILRIHALTLELSVRAAHFESPSPHLYDVFLPEYCEIVALCRAVINHPHFVRSYVFDAGIVPVLFIVVVKCRDKLVRREAIAVLKAASPRREGLWDSMMVARIGEALIKAEEENPEFSQKQWDDIHLRCLNTTCPLPSVSRRSKPGRGSYEARTCLLDWVESCVKLNAVSDRDDS